MRADHERLAEALAIHRALGEAGAVWIAARVGALALVRDEAGIARFRSIAAAFQQLIGARVQ